MRFILIWPKFLSKDAGILEICFSCISNCDGNLTDISLRTSVSYERHSVSELIGTSSFSIFSILDAVVRLNPLIFLLVVQKFDHIFQIWPQYPE